MKLLRKSDLCREKEMVQKRTKHHNVKDGKIPKLSVQIKMGFPQIPPDLKLYLMEE